MTSIGDAIGLTDTQQAAVLNHANTATVQRYRHLMPGKDVEARERLWDAVKAIIS